MSGERKTPGRGIGKTRLKHTPLDRPNGFVKNRMNIGERLSRDWEAHEINRTKKSRNYHDMHVSLIRFESIYFQTLENITVVGTYIRDVDTLVMLPRPKQSRQSGTLIPWAGRKAHPA